MDAAVGLDNIDANPRLKPINDDNIKCMKNAAERYCISDATKTTLEYEKRAMIGAAKKPEAFLKIPAANKPSKDRQKKTDTRDDVADVKADLGHDGEEQKENEEEPEKDHVGSVAEAPATADTPTLKVPKAAATLIKKAAAKLFVRPANTAATTTTTTTTTAAVVATLPNLQKRFPQRLSPRPRNWQNLQAFSNACRQGPGCTNTEGTGDKCNPTASNTSTGDV